jgi:hypothetical protein
MVLGVEVVSETLLLGWLYSLHPIKLKMPIIFNASHNDPFTVLSWLLSVVMFGIFTAKDKRDHRLLKKAEEERQAATQIPPTPTQVSQGSHHLFVPPPKQEK